MTKGFVLGFVTALAVLIVGGYFFVTLGGLYAGQDVKPGGLERWGARGSLRATMRRGTQGLSNRLQPTDENLSAGIELYDTHCRVCHGGFDGVASPIAKGLTPTAPQLAKDGVEDDPVETTYWKIAHGIRFTGMPAFRASLSDQQMWQIALFASRMKGPLPPRAQRAWEMQTAAP
jgi:thiosulfate dehydrogenase